MKMKPCPINHGICANCYWDKGDCVLRMRDDTQPEIDRYSPSAQHRKNILGVDDQPE